jgi:hypothetical protein
MGARLLRSAGRGITTAGLFALSDHNNFCALGLRVEGAFSFTQARAASDVGEKINASGGAGREAGGGQRAGEAVAA